MPFNRLRVFGSKFFTIVAGLNRRYFMLSLPLKIIVIFILKSIMIVLSFDISLATGFVVYAYAAIAYPAQFGYI